MAEENVQKKSTTKNSAKKSTTTKRKTEEVKVEKRFCTKCGKELLEGEVCSCNNQTEVVSINTDAITSMGKGVINTIINMYKKPSTTLDDEVKKVDTKSNLIILALIAISFGLYIMASFSRILVTMSGASRVSISHYIDIPYFKVFLYVSILYFALSFIPVIASYLVARLTKNYNFSLKKSLSLYATSMAPTILTNLLMAILYYLNLLTFVGAIIGSIVGVACFFHYALGYLASTDIPKDKKSYALTSLIIIWIVSFIIAILVFAGSFLTDITKEVNYKNNSTYSDLFNW